MEQKFNLSGTHDELQTILEKEFKLSSDVARVAVAIFIYEQNQGGNHAQLMKETLWFLDAKDDEYQSHIFSTRYTISFSQAMLDVLDDLIVPIFLVVCGAGELAALEGVLYSIKALVKNLRRVKDNECCVYFQILQYLKKNSSKWFSVEDVTPEIGNEAICINLDKKWRCKFRCNRQNCNIQPNDVKKILEEFCADNVMEMNEERTLYKFKI